MNSNMENANVEKAKEIYDKTLLFNYNNFSDYKEYFKKLKEIDINLPKNAEVLLYIFENPPFGETLIGFSENLVKLFKELNNQYPGLQRDAQVIDAFLDYSYNVPLIENLIENFQKSTIIYSLHRNDVYFDFLKFINPDLKKDSDFITDLITEFPKQVDKIYNRDVCSSEVYDNSEIKQLVQNIKKDIKFVKEEGLEKELNKPGCLLLL